MSTFKVTDEYFEYEGTRYFREGANEVELGTYGQKKSSVRIAPEGDIARTFLTGNVTKSHVQHFDWARVSGGAAHLEARLKVLDFSGGASITNVDRGHLALVHLLIKEGKLKQILNEEAGKARAFLRQEGGDARVVSNVWVVASGRLGEALKTEGACYVAANAAGLELSFGLKARERQTVTLERGATFAFYTHRVKRWNDDKTIVLDLEDDTEGMG
jgi:hypothetical protein